MLEKAGQDSSYHFSVRVIGSDAAEEVYCKGIVGHIGYRDDQEAKYGCHQFAETAKEYQVL